MFGGSFHRVISDFLWKPLTGHRRKTCRKRRSLSSRVDAATLDVVVRYISSFVMTPLWMISNGDTSVPCMTSAITLDASISSISVVLSTSVSSVVGHASASSVTPLSTVPICKVTRQLMNNLQCSYRKSNSRIFDSIIHFQGFPSVYFTTKCIFTTTFTLIIHKIVPLVPPPMSNAMPGIHLDSGFESVPRRTVKKAHNFWLWHHKDGAVVWRHVVAVSCVLYVFCICMYVWCTPRHPNSMYSLRGNKPSLSL